MAQVPAALWDAQGAVIAAQTTQIAEVKTRLSLGFAEAADLCDALTAENAALAALANDDIYYDMRRRSLLAHAQMIESLLLTQQQQSLLDLQFNGIEIDLDVVKCLLVGKNLLISEP